MARVFLISPEKLVVGLFYREIYAEKRAVGVLKFFIHSWASVRLVARILSSYLYSQIALRRLIFQAIYLIFSLQQIFLRATSTERLAL